MVGSNLRPLILTVCMVGVPNFHDLAAKESAIDAKAIEGLWSGSWGGGDVNGVVFQPVMVELFLRGDYVELCSFGKSNRLTGTVRFDPTVKQMLITPTAEARGSPTKVIVFTYEINDGKLTLIDSDKFPISLHRQPVTQDPLANVQCT